MEERPYQKLVAWKEAHTLCLKVYEYTAHFPDHEKFGLVCQMRHSAYSVPTNVAEGNGRRSVKEKIHFIDIASASLDELHYQTVLSLDLRYLTSAEAQDLFGRINRTGYLLQRLRSSLR